MPPNPRKLPVSSKPAGGKTASGKPKAGGDPSVRRRKQAERTYGKPGAPERHADGGSGDDFHDDGLPRKAAPRSTAPRPGGSRPPAPAAPRPEPTRAVETDEPVRLNRLLARSGIASRRESDAIIAAGRVSVNGAVVTEMGVQVGPRDKVTVDGRPVGPVGLTYILMNKPTGAITTTSDERDRRTVMDLLDLPKAETDGLFPVGRLDRNTSGALLLTTDGDLAHRLMHPRYETVKLYMCRTERALTDADLDRLLRGVELDDGLAKADQAQFVSPDPHVVALGLHEGRNRQVRRMVEALGTRVEALERIAYAGLTLDGLRRGKWRKLHPHEVNALRRKVKLKAIVYDAR